jgi:phosphatidylserine/phosphatidylglycerophosphate/cardiolipin synthase-like enzyme
MPGDGTDLNALIDRHLAEFDRPGVLAVRPGYQVRDDWLTGRRAIVVTVVSKVADPPAGRRLPTEIEGVPVDVRQASPDKRMEIEEPERYARRLLLSPDAGSVPHFADERTPGGERPAARASAHAVLASVPKPELDYTAPLGAGLVPITARTTIHLAASPDAGWPMLRDFLAGTRETLTVGLYDFTSAHVLAAVRQAVAGKQVRLVLDHPPKNPTADQTDATTAADLAGALGAGLTQAWALTRTDRLATAWIFPTAYHIKVAVRDSTSVWLSSGNWNNSNQPDIDPATVAADATEARHRDRDWHVVLDQPDLATVFESYLTNDLTIATAHNDPHPPADPPLPPPGPGSTQTPAFAQFFAGTTVTDTIRITPLLTPDPGGYASAVRALIGSARHSLCMQFQYIELPRQVDATSQAFADLVRAVVDRQRAGVAVRIIMSEFEKVGYLEQLQAAGLDVVHGVRIQNNVHNKGIVVDGSSVLVSSQNWSTDGTLYNRDAGVVIENEAAAAYFQRIFDHDWDHLAKPKALPD